MLSHSPFARARTRPRLVQAPAPGQQDERVPVEDDLEFGEYPDFVTLVEAQHGYPATRIQ